MGWIFSYPIQKYLISIHSVQILSNAQYLLFKKPNRRKIRFVVHLKLELIFCTPNLWINHVGRFHVVKFLLLIMIIIFHTFGPLQCPKINFQTLQVSNCTKRRNIKKRKNRQIVPSE